MHFSVTCTTKDNSYGNIDFVFCYPFSKNDHFSSVRKTSDISVRLLSVIYQFVLLWTLWDEPIM